MIRVIVECDGVKASIEDEEAITLSHALELVGNALKGVGFVFGGELEIVEEERIVGKEIEGDIL